VLAVRALCATFHKARRAVRRYPPGHRLRDASVKEFVECAQRITSRGEVRLRVADADVFLDGEHVFTEPNPGDPVPALGAFGLSGLCLTCDATPDALRELVELLAGDDPDSPSPSPQRPTVAGGLPGIELCSTTVARRAE